MIGIYIRFGGPVEAKEEIIKAFNSNKEVQNHNLRAYSIKENIDNPIEFFPDICVTNNEFIKAFKRPEGVSSILRGDMISLKAHEPLAVDCGNFTEEDKKLYDGRDLTAIYDLVLQKFNIQIDYE